jgi:hypothetical protein
MVKVNGLDLTAVNAPALKTLPGWEMWSMPITFIHGLNAQTKVPATAPLVFAIASLDMTVSHVRELFVRITAMIAAPAGLRSSWQARLAALTLLRGMQ